jgi:vacuolar-type H+-ATPase subunit H
MSHPEEPISMPQAKPSAKGDSTKELSAVVARQIGVIVQTAEQAANDLTSEVEYAATRRATDILVESERKADGIIEEATELSADHLTEARRQIDDFAAERIRRLSELADGLIEVAETIQARHAQVEELNHRLHELITVVGSAAEAVAREAARPDPDLPSPPKRKRAKAAKRSPSASERKGPRSPGSKPPAQDESETL